MQGSLKKIGWWRSGEILILLLMLIGGWWLFNHLRLSRQEVAQRRHDLDQIPQQIASQAVGASELEKRRHDIDRIGQLVVTRQQIGEVVSTLERLGQQRGIDVRVADVEEVPVVDERGQSVPPAGPFVDVRLSVVAYGSPAALTSFLHAIEYMPYVVAVPQWRIRREAPQLPPELRASPSADEGDQPPPRSTPSVTVGQFDASLLLTIRYEKSES